ncbi:MAG: site-specific DNA-methyltransferase, partial [Leptospiraceae bacterium]|nr:site-specific DNA-methyltransferase [Leptospiraceae bacterium]
KWLCMMYPRLKLLHKLLADDGVIFISIDDNEQANLKLICDEIFGRRNFIANISIVNNFKGRSDDKYIATSHESLLVFHKGNFITNGVPIPEEYSKEYKLKDSKGLYRLQGLRKRGSGSKRDDRPNMFYPFYYNKQTNELSINQNSEKDIEILPKLSDNTDGRWRWGKETALERIDELTVQLVKTRNEYDIFQKDYLVRDGENKTIKPKSFWYGSEFSAEAGTLQLKSIFTKKTFDTPKSTDFLQYILYQATNKNSIILDSFAGSGTTAHAVLNLNKQDGGNRKFILIEMENYAESITAERVKRVISGYGEGSKATEGTGGSFDFYKLEQPLFNEDKNLNEGVGIDRIRKYVWYTETKREFSEPTQTDNKHFLGTKDETAYYFNYEPNKITTLNRELLATMKTKAEQYVIYADNCLLTKEFMSKHNIIFKKIPRDISRF